MIAESSIVGCLLGGAVGDALGLPYEGLSPSRAARLLGEPDRYRFAFGGGMISDDTEHACLAAQALIESGGDPELFGAALGRRMRRWFLCGPAGIGLATLRACGKLCLGVPAKASGVYSAGNGPAMRAAILGAAVDDLPQLRSIVRNSTRITHVDPKAEFGAWAVALASRFASEPDGLAPERFAAAFRESLGEGGDEAVKLIDGVAESVFRREPTLQFAAANGSERGVSGYVYRTVPVALHAAMSHPDDLQGAVHAAIRCGGDTDTVAAIAGGVVGCAAGRSGVPESLLQGLRDWPRSIAWIESLGTALFRSRLVRLPQTPPEVSVLKALPRNAAFAAVVLAHGFRRLAPPYA
jgi:ADP-ribosyl-[dinitrogen reductase] hydrolase